MGLAGSLSFYHQAPKVAEIRESEMIVMDGWMMLKFQGTLFR